MLSRVQTILSVFIICNSEPSFAKAKKHFLYPVDLHIQALSERFCPNTD